MIKEKKKILIERMQILLSQAIANAKSNPSLASNQAMLARKIATKNRVPIPYEMRISFCKKCKNFIAPGINSRIRIGRTSLKSIRITCLLCGHTYRKVIG